MEIQLELIVCFLIRKVNHLSFLILYDQCLYITDRHVMEQIGILLFNLLLSFFQIPHLQSHLLTMQNNQQYTDNNEYGSCPYPTVVTFVKSRRLMIEHRSFGTQLGMQILLFQYCIVKEWSRIRFEQERNITSRCTIHYLVDYSQHGFPKSFIIEYISTHYTIVFGYLDVSQHKQSRRSGCNHHIRIGHQGNVLREDISRQPRREQYSSSSLVYLT